MSEKLLKFVEVGKPDLSSGSERKRVEWSFVESDVVDGVSLVVVPVDVRKREPSAGLLW